MAKDGEGQDLKLLATDLDAPHCLPAAGGYACVYTSRAPEKPVPNQDAAAVLCCDETRCVLAVADGMGGLPHAAEAAGVALDELCDAVRHAVESERELRDGILDGFEKANAAVRSLHPGAGTTLAAVEIDTGTMRTYHAGDSAVLAVGQRGQLRWRTVAHSPVGYAVEAGLLDPRGAMNHDERHLISNLVGSESMRIDVGPPIALRMRDTVLLATDGLTDNLHGEEIVEQIRKGRLGDAATNLRAVCRQRMAGNGDHPSKPDDLTFILFRPAV